MEQKGAFNDTGRDPQLWLMAQKRVSFKYHLVSYVVIISFLWIMWSVTGNSNFANRRFPWPVFPTLGWGIGLFFHYMGAYVYHRNGQVEKEYEKLKQHSSIN